VTGVEASGGGSNAALVTPIKTIPVAEARRIG